MRITLGQSLPFLSEERTAHRPEVAKADRRDRYQRCPGPTDFANTSLITRFGRIFTKLPNVRNPIFRMRCDPRGMRKDRRQMVWEASRRLPCVLPVFMFQGFLIRQRNGSLLCLAGCILRETDKNLGESAAKAPDLTSGP